MIVIVAQWFGHLQQNFLHNHERHIILNLSLPDMDAISQRLHNIPGVTSIGQTRNSEHGKWFILASKNITQHSLDKFDHILSTHKLIQPFRWKPRRLQIHREHVTPTIINAWTKQTATYHAPSRPKNYNAWTVPLHPKKSTEDSIKKSTDDRSITTTSTTTSTKDEIQALTNQVQQLQQQLKALQHTIQTPTPKSTPSTALHNITKKLQAQDNTLDQIIKQNKKDLEALRATVQATGASISHISQTTDILNKKVDQQHQTLEERITKNEDMVRSFKSFFQQFSNNIEGNFTKLNTTMRSQKSDIKSDLIKILDTKLDHHHPRSQKMLC